MKGDGGWIKFWKDMREDPRLMDAAQLLAENYHLSRKTSPIGGEDLSPGDALRFASNALRGALVTLWCYADDHIRNDDTLPMGSNTLDAFVGIEGFFAMVPRDWVAELDDGTLKLPGYCEKNALITKKKRAVDAKLRQAAWRARQQGKSNATHNDIVTRHEPVMKCVDQDVDRDQDKDKKKKNVEKENRATRLPADWQPSPAQRTFASDLGLSADRVAEDFRDYWHAIPGARGVKLDWPATWHRWCRKALDMEPTSRPNGHAPGMQRDVAAWSEARALAKQIGFREPWPQESVGSYATAAKLARDRPPALTLAQLQARAQR